MIIVITLTVWRSVDIWSEDRASRSEPTSAAAKLRPGEPRDWSFGRRCLGRTPQLRFLAHFYLHLALWPLPLTTFCLVGLFSLSLASFVVTWLSVPCGATSQLWRACLSSCASFASKTPSANAAARVTQRGTPSLATVKLSPFAFANGLSLSLPLRGWSLPMCPSLWPALSGMHHSPTCGS